jgi:hypothetical protein
MIRYNHRGSGGNPKACVSSIATNLIHQKSPWVTAWWSAAFPGFGQIIIRSYLKGFILIVWEFLVNINANINVAILYSFTDRFEEAKNVLNKRWTFLYIGVFVYAIWDSYRSATDLNKFSILADREHAPLTPFKIGTLDLNYFDKKNPWVAAAWSAVMPGTGHLYTHRLPTGFFILIWWIAISYYSRLYEAACFSMVGDFHQILSVCDPVWFLFMPTVYCFAVYDSYVNTIEYNRLFNIEQSRFPKDNYQHSNFDLRGLMQVFCKNQISFKK